MAMLVKTQSLYLYYFLLCLTPLLPPSRSCGITLSNKVLKQINICFRLCFLGYLGNNNVFNQLGKFSTIIPSNTSSDPHPLSFSSETPVECMLDFFFSTISSGFLILSSIIFIYFSLYASLCLFSFPSVLSCSNSLFSYVKSDVKPTHWILNFSYCTFSVLKFLDTSFKKSSMSFWYSFQGFVGVFWLNCLS